MKKIIIAAILSAILCGCVTAKKMNRLSVGMTKQEVVHVMGYPASTASPGGGIEILRYELSSTRLQAEYHITEEYYVKLVDGRVDSYGRIGDATGIAAPNSFSQFYQDFVGANITNLPPYSGETKVFAGSTTNDLKEQYRNDYVIIGASSFQGPPQSKANDDLMSQAKNVGADVVLYSCEYLGSHQTTMPWIQYNSGQANTTISSGTASASVGGSGGYANGTGNYYGSSTTTIPGTFSTQVVPTTVERYHYEAYFLRKGKPPILGIRNVPLPTEIRQQLERNTGVLVWVVINDSPAFNANILEGDVILKMNGEDVTSVKDFSGKIHQLAGQKVNIEIWRNGQLQTIPVKLNEAH